MASEPDELQDEAWVAALIEQIGEGRLLKALGRVLTKSAQQIALSEPGDGDSEDLVSNLLFQAARHCEDAAMDLYVASK